MEYNQLTPEEAAIIVQKQTEPAFSGEYDEFFRPGVYVCRRCNNPLFNSEAKFRSGCGWPSFDEHFVGAVTQTPDPDGQRTEICCANCGGHLGHVFLGERMTDKNTRHCVNSLSIKFIPRKLTPKVF